MRWMLEKFVPATNQYVDTGFEFTGDCLDVVVIDAAIKQAGDLGLKQWCLRDVPEPQQDGLPLDIQIAELRMVCPTCGYPCTLSPKRRFWECWWCGFSVLVAADPPECPVKIS